jgi:hypothetical protein
MSVDTHCLSGEDLILDRPVDTSRLDACQICRSADVCSSRRGDHLGVPSVDPVRDKDLRHTGTGSLRTCWIGTSMGDLFRGQANVTGRREGGSQRSPRNGIQHHIGERDVCRECDISRARSAAGGGEH